MARLPGGAEILDVIEVQRDEAQVESREIEMPFPFVAGQCEELAVGRGFDVINSVGRGLRAARADLAVMVAENGHQGCAAKEVAVRVDEGAEGFGAFLALLMQAGHVVTGREQQMHIVFEDGAHVFSHRITPVADNGDAEVLARVTFEGGDGGCVIAAAHAVVIQHVTLP